MEPLIFWVRDSEQGGRETIARSKRWLRFLTNLGVFSISIDFIEKSSLALDPDG
jgi:hypothetical protein